MLSGGEIFIILLAAILLFGSKKLPEIAKSLGKGMNEIKKATDEIKKEITKDEIEIAKDVNEIKNTVNKIKVFDNNDFNLKENK